MGSPSFLLLELNWTLWGLGVVIDLRLKYVSLIVGPFVLSLTFGGLDRNSKIFDFIIR